MKKSVGRFLTKHEGAGRWLGVVIAALGVMFGVHWAGPRRLQLPAPSVLGAHGVSHEASTKAPPKSFQRIVPGLEETLVATRAPTPEEDRALTNALDRFRTPAQPTADAIDAYAPLIRFAENYPHSAWSAAVQTNLGLAYYRAGYFSRAFQSWEAAWHEGRAATEPHAKALVDRAIGELARMHARIGHAEEIRALLSEIGDRPLSGPATEAITGAREGAWTMQNNWGIAYLCGPKALKNVLLARHAKERDVAFLDSVRAGKHGFSLKEVAELARTARLSYKLIHREVGEAIPVPAIVHWKVHHYAAITALESGRYHVEDPTFGGAQGDLSVSAAAIDAEGSGYFLVPSEQPQDSRWRPVTNAEAQTVYGMGTTSDSQQGSTTNDDDKMNKDESCHGMCAYNAHTMVVSLNLNDSPLGYRPQKGPPVFVRLTYNQREATQPANPSFFNVSPKWTLNVLSYIEDNPDAAGTGVTRYVAGGGRTSHASYNATTGAFAPDIQTQAVLVRVPATGPLSSYELRMPDGSKDVFGFPDGSTTNPRRVFLTKQVDPTGNALTLNYEPNDEAGPVRLLSLTDAAGRSTTFSYSEENPLLLQTITDPFQRSAHLSYDENGRLESIRDVLGLESKFSYDAGGLIDGMTTPYGTSHFAYGETSQNGRWLEMTDAMGFTERLEFNQASGIPGTIEASAIPSGVAVTNGYYAYRNTFYWDKHAYPGYGAADNRDYTKATITHWLHVASTSVTSPIVEGTKKPLEGRVFYNYPGQSNPYYSGKLDAPSVIGRVLDDGSTQLSQATYNPLGKPLTTIDPVGRSTTFEYDANGIDLLSIRRGSSPGHDVTVARFAYYDDARHLLKTATDQAGNVTSYGYNDAGQLTSLTDAKKNLTTYEYDRNGRLSTVADGKGTTLLGLAYDAFDRVATRTDSSGYTVAFEYDDFDRVTKATYPDQTTELYAYNALDLASVTDRLGKTISFEHDANRRLTKVTDALGNETSYTYYENGALKSATDGNGHTTSWEIDVQGRPTAKHYANGATEVTNYEASTSRIESRSDALGQHTEYRYNADDSLASVSYPDALYPTPSVSFTYDATFSRLASMSDGNGETTFDYYPITTPSRAGAGLLQSVTSPVAGTELATDTIRLSYDSLNRVIGKTVNGAVEATQYDALGRVVSVSNPLDVFSYAYADPTSRVREITSGAGFHVGLDYFEADHDGLLQQLTFSAPDESLLSQFGYTYDANHNVLTFSQSYRGQQFALLDQKSGRDGRDPGVGVRNGFGRAPAWPSNGTFVALAFALLALSWRASGRFALRWPGRVRLAPFAVALAMVSCGDDEGPAGPGGSGSGAIAGGAAGGAHSQGGSAGSGMAPAGGSAEGGSPEGGTPSSSQGGKNSSATGGEAVMSNGGSAGTEVEATGGLKQGEGGALSGALAQVTTYTYDDRDRVVSALVGTDLGAADQPQFSYAYDAVSNLTTIVTDVTSRSLKHTLTNGISGLDYDLNGSPLSGEGKEYTWDGANRLVKVVAGEHESVFSYDGFSRLVRIVEKLGAAVRSDRAFTWCGGERCLERDNLVRGSPVSKQYFAQGLKSAGQSYFYVTDRLGSVRQVVDESGAVAAQYDYDVYGNRTKLAGAADSEVGYAGYFQHPESALNFALYRAYDATIGRWLNRDPLGEESGVNLYAYARGNPVKRSDPSGLDVWIEGPSGGEPSFHQSINVGNPNGSYASYSFGVNGRGVLQGEVYRDEEKGGTIEKYKETTPAQDAVIQQQLDNEVGKTGTYGYDDICRSYSQRKFNEAPGIEKAPPPRTPIPQNGGPTGSSTGRSTTGTVSTTGTSTSK